MDGGRSAEFFTRLSESKFICISRNWNHNGTEISIADKAGHFIDMAVCQFKSLKNIAGEIEGDGWIWREFEACLCGEDPTWRTWLGGDIYVSTGLGECLYYPF